MRIKAPVIELDVFPSEIVDELLYLATYTSIPTTTTTISAPVTTQDTTRSMSVAAGTSTPQLCHTMCKHSVQSTSLTSIPTTTVNPSSSTATGSASTSTRKRKHPEHIKLLDRLHSGISEKCDCRKQ